MLKKILDRFRTTKGPAPEPERTIGDKIVRALEKHNWDAMWLQSSTSGPVLYLQRLSGDDFLMEITAGPHGDRKINFYQLRVDTQYVPLPEQEQVKITEFLQRYDYPATAQAKRLMQKLEDELNEQDD